MITNETSTIEYRWNGIKTEKDPVGDFITPNHFSWDFLLSNFVGGVAGHRKVLLGKHPVRNIEQ